MPIHKVWSSYSPNAEFSTYVGKPGELFYRPDTGTIHVSDGDTPGGLTIASEGTIENSQKLNGELPEYYLDYNNFTNTPTQVSALANDAGYITSPDGGNADQLDGENGVFYLNYANFTGVPTDLSDFDNDLDFIQSSEKGAVDGVATLNGTGLVPPSQLPSFVSDVEEYAAFEDFPAEGDTGKIYVADDTGDIFRWSGSNYIKISDAASTADQAIKLATARTISLAGDATGSVSFDGTSDVSINTVIEDDSHSHVIANVDGLQGALDSKLEYTDLSAGGDLSYNSTTGEFAFTERTDAEVRGLVSAGGDLSYNSTTGEFSVTTYKSTDFDTDFGNKSTTDLHEGTNLYYTDGRANSAIDTRVDKTFVDNLGADADTLDGEEGSYYLDYNNFTNTPSGQSLSDDGATTDITDDTVSVVNLPNTDIGPIESMTFDITHTHSGSEPAGNICWSTEDDTLSIVHPNGVRQQVGQEQYAYVINNTGSTINNGSAVRVAGADLSDDEARVEVALFQANGVYPNVQALGLSTEDIANGAAGRVTVFGKIRDIDTTGTLVGETWAEGDELYASPNSPGALTKTKPTSPNNVVPLAQVLRAAGANDGGELFVRPVLDQRLDYGVFTRSTDFDFAATDTAYVLELTNTEFSSGVDLDNVASRAVASQSGLYQVEWNLLWSTAGGPSDEDNWYTWLRKNGTDIPNSMRRGSIDGEVENMSFFTARIVSLDADDYIEVAVAVSSTDISLSAFGEETFGPANASLEVNISQIQL